MLAAEVGLSTQLCTPKQVLPGVFSWQLLEDQELLTADNAGHACLVQQDNMKPNGASQSCSLIAFAKSCIDRISPPHDIMGTLSRCNRPFAFVSMLQPVQTVTWSNNHVMSFSRLLSCNLIRDHKCDESMRFESTGFVCSDETLQTAQHDIMMVYGSEVYWGLRCMQYGASSVASLVEQHWFPDSVRDFHVPFVQPAMSGGGKQAKSQGDRSSNTWQAGSTAWLTSDDIYYANVAAQARMFGPSVDSIEMRRFVDFRRMQTTTHTCLLRNLHNFDQVAALVLGGEGCEHVTDTMSAIIAALHCGVASSLIFTDNIHWRCIHFDPVRKKILCNDPYGNGNPSIRFRQDVSGALQRLTQVWCQSWTVQETALVMQHRSDGHSCGVWVVWMADEWMKYVQAGLPDPGFEGWLHLQMDSSHVAGSQPKQSSLRIYYGQLIAETAPMDPVATRPLFRPAYFSKLYEYWLRQRGTAKMALGNSQYQLCKLQQQGAHPLRP